MKNFSAEELRELLRYDPVTGVVTRLTDTLLFRVGSVVGRPDRDGYLQTEVFGRRYQLHRLIWLHVHGDWPAGMIDHINGEKGDNRLCNLRVCNNQQNQWNRVKPGTRNKTGLIGVSERDGRWRTTIKVNGKSRFLGDHDTPEAASAAYWKAKSELHPTWAQAR